MHDAIIDSKPLKKTDLTVLGIGDCAASISSAVMPEK